MSAIDCNKEMMSYHAEEVTLSSTDQAEMRARRDNGRIRLKNGLSKAGHPLPKDIVSQGSYAMKTMVEDPDCDYDIDDGVYFEKEDLKDEHGNYLGARAARMRVRQALKDERLSYDAVVKNNCVRQKYPDGYHIDIPVYRIVRSKDVLGNATIEYELASSDEWVRSDARAVTKWFNDAAGQKLNSGEVDNSQLRRITKLTKKFARSRVSWKPQTTSGICVSKLVVDKISKVSGRDDDALRDTWKAIKTSLDLTLQIDHPVLAGKQLAQPDDAEVSFFRDCLTDALKTLEILDAGDCTREKALKAWDKVFNSSHFVNQLNKGSGKSLLQPAVTASALEFPNKPIVPNKSSGFA